MGIRKHLFSIFFFFFWDSYNMPLIMQLKLFFFEIVGCHVWLDALPLDIVALVDFDVH